MAKQLVELGGGSVSTSQIKRKDQVPTQSFEKVVKLVLNRVSPLWDTRDYVAVNPLFGYRDQDFLEILKRVYAYQDTLLLPSRKYLRKKFKNGEIKHSDLSRALTLFQTLNKSQAQRNIDLNQVTQFLNEDSDTGIGINSVKSLTDLYDLKFQTKESEWVTNEVSKWVSAYFDEGQSLWRMPKTGKGLFSSWKNLVLVDHHGRASGDHFKELVKNLTNDPFEAVKQLCELLSLKIVLNESLIEDYLSKLLSSVSGWASFIKKIDFERELLGQDKSKDDSSGLIDLLAIRLTYDLAYIEEPINIQNLGIRKEVGDEENFKINLNYIWLLADEISTRRQISEKLKFKTSSEIGSRPLAQMAFCIDVRSEIIRRHLESRSEDIQTIGFAGFFGVPLALKKLGFEGGDHQCPVLFKPAFEVTETSEAPLEVAKSRQRKAFGFYGKSEAQLASSSSFSLAETFGFSYIGKMLSNSLGISSPNKNLNLYDAKLKLDLSAIDLKQKTDLAHGVLSNMGLTKNFAPYVFFFGHGGESANNPYESALDCGACAGHNGKYNAEFLAGILNEEVVRQKLAQTGIDIPEDTVFISGWHNTTRDILVIDDEVNSDEFQLLKTIMESASQDCRVERSKYLFEDGKCEAKNLKLELQKRAKDWSEIRPEWALARNHSFIVGRRSLTRKVNLEGRSFLHDYDESEDPGLKRLELIMTAPMIVTNWINMQYFTSTIDPKKFGADNKVLNNVVGTIGCIQGNGSDLLGGLSEQSVRINGEYFHEPVRLQVFIEANPDSIAAIIEKHQMVSDLVNNEWLNIISIDPESGELKLRTKNKWKKLEEELWS